MKYILSAFADEYSDDFDEQIAVLRRLGIPDIELRHANGKPISEFTAADVCEFSKKLRDNGLGVSSLGSPIGKIPIDGDLNAHFALAEKIFDMAGAFSAKYVRVFSFYLPRGGRAEDYRTAVLDATEKLVSLAERYGVTLCHENEANIYGESPTRCLDLLETFGGRMKCVFDMGNFVLDGYDPEEAFRLLQEHIAYFHIKDALREGAIVPAGKGDAKIEEILRAFLPKGECFVSLEPHLQTFAGLNALVGKPFDNPYKFKDQQTAFCEAFLRFHEILTGIG